MKKIGINLTGGGARGSYQAGVLLALGELLSEMDLLGEKNPIKIWSGTSAGAINSTFLAAHADDLLVGTKRLAGLWQALTPEQVYQTDMISLGSNSARWIRDLTFGPLFKTKLAQHLLNTTPLLHLINDNLPFSRIDDLLREKFIEAVSCSSYCYNTSETVNFLQASKPFHWDRRRRRVENTSLNAKHVLASCSIPLLFPPTQLDELFYGDGGFRNTAPLAPTIKLGSEKMLLIGVKYIAPPQEVEGAPGKPGVANIAGSALNALFMDSLELDIERMNHVNEIITAFGNMIQTERSEYHFVDFKVLRPSRNISKIAEARSEKGLPPLIQYLLKGLGSGRQTADLASYILFEPEFIGELVSLGYNDFLAQKEEIAQWLQA